jgi:RNA polymerase sigma-70 factor (ECF subfamily)
MPIATFKLGSIAVAAVSAWLLPILGSASGDGEPEPQSPQAKPEWSEDHDLVRKVIDGDATAFRCLVERYQGRIYSIVYGMVRNREDARDLSQEAFVKAYRNLERFRFSASFYTWLCRIAMNVSIDHLRKQKIRRASAYDDGIGTKDAAGVISLAHHRGDPSRSMERKQLRARITAALESLPEDQKEVIILREIDGLSYKEISDIMEIPEGTVMSRLYYARKKMQQALKAERN